MNLARGFRRAECEHLDLGELVHAIKAAAGPAGGPRFGAETVREPDVLERQVGLGEDIVGVHPAQRDLGGADQAQVAVLDRIDLRLLAAGGEPDALQDIITGQVGRDDRREAPPRSSFRARSCWSARSSSTASFLRK